MAERISVGGIVLGVLLVLFGAFTIAILYYMGLPGEAVAGSGIFIVAGAALFVYSFLTRETHTHYAMNKFRAALYALSTASISFGIFSAVMSRFATGEIYIAIASAMVFCLAGIGLFLLLALTGVDRRKSR